MFYYLSFYVSYCLSPLLIPLVMFFLIIPHVTSKMFILFSFWFFIIYISHAIHLLTNIFLILNKNSVDIILVHSLHHFSFVVLHRVATSALLSLFLSLFSLCYTFFQVLDIFLSSLSLLSGDVLTCLWVS